MAWKKIQMVNGQEYHINFDLIATMQDDPRGGTVMFTSNGLKFQTSLTIEEIYRIPDAS